MAPYLLIIFCPEGVMPTKTIFISHAVADMPVIAQT